LLPSTAPTKRFDEDTFLPFIAELLKHSAALKIRKVYAVHNFYGGIDEAKNIGVLSFVPTRVNATLEELR
jgi:hypothetical protein